MTAKKAPVRKTAARKTAPKGRRPSASPPTPPPPATRAGHVALIGRPNVGKSTLLNRILGQKVAIVSDKPQTTRLSLLGIKTTERGQVVFIDNPGIHKPLHKLNRRMMSYVDSSLETADVVCLLIDATASFGHGDSYVLDMLRKVAKPVFLLINKVDVIRKDKVLTMIDSYKDLYPFREIIPISALKGTNLDVLERLLLESLPRAEFIYPEGDLSDQSERFLLAELVREKLLERVRMELPFVTAVYIDNIERRGQGGAETGQTAEMPAKDASTGKTPGLRESPEEDDLGREPRFGSDGPGGRMKTGRRRADLSGLGEAGDPDGRRPRLDERQKYEDDLESGNEMDDRPEAGKSGMPTPEWDSPGEARWPGVKNPIHSGLPERPPGGRYPRPKTGPRRRELPVTLVQASIFVEKPSHRQIILGRQGRVIKEIGIEARRDMERYLGTRVYLDLQVKVRPNWRDAADVLDLIEGQK